MYRVLIADDEQIERIVIRNKLVKNYGPKIALYEAENGRLAIEQYKKYNCQIAILDIEMPGVNGLQAASEIRAYDPKAVIIFLTAFDEFAYAKKAISVKALDYMLKPVVEEEFLITIDEAMHSVDCDSKVSFNSVNAGDSVFAQMNTQIHEKNSIKSLILEFIDQNYMQDICLQDVAKELNYAEAYFCKIFRENFNESFITYLTLFRIEKAKELIQNQRYSIKEIGSYVGYHDSNYFTKVFKRIVGITPSEYRMQGME